MYNLLAEADLPLDLAQRLFQPPGTEQGNASLLDDTGSVGIGMIRVSAGHADELVFLAVQLRRVTALAAFPRRVFLLSQKRNATPTLRQSRSGI